MFAGEDKIGKSQVKDVKGIDLKAQLICMQEKLEAKEWEVEKLVHEVRDAKVVATEAQKESVGAVLSHANSL